MTYLFYLSIGPVQSFIAQARKTQDLYAGSQILSKTIEKAVELSAAEIIFPDFSQNNKYNSAPNHFLGIIEVADPTAYGQKLEEELRVWYVEYLRQGVMRMGDKNIYSLTDLKNIQGFEEQIANHLEIYWLFEPMADATNYSSVYKEIMHKRLGVKALRAFQQYNYSATAGEKGRKCSLDGERNVKFYRLNAFEYGQKDKLPAKLFSTATEVEVLDFHTIQPPPTLRHLQPGEGLSAVSFAKRCWDNTAYKFPSTAEVALCRVATEYKTDFEVFAKVLKENLGIRREDCWQLYYEENLNANYLKKQIGAQEAEKWAIMGEKILKAHQELTDKLKDAKLSKYYAVISFDGDDMGKWWQGEYLPKEGEYNLKTFQQDLAKAFRHFADWANNDLFRGEAEVSGGGDDLTIVFRGRTIYAGGDDYLGVVNLDFLWDTLDALNSQFEKILEPVIEKYGIGEPITFTAGVSIAHYKEPLQRVLADAQRLQKKAKSTDKPSKNKLGLSVLKHSGEMHECVLDKKGILPMKNLVGQLQKEVSNTFIKKAHAKYWHLLNHKGFLNENRQGGRIIEYFLTELYQWHRQSYLSNSDNGNISSVIADVYNSTSMLDEESSRPNQRNLLNALSTADFIATKANLE